ncbi:unnamed protein product [Lactuca virosa]|uniref:Uncharacterized protein n=1 Tax=Lactuca virosa TaxID=75947 RepID=A0AAU9NVX4_9ASTR|nr:unnamed protein product [Lactuca virosa]
MNQPSPANASSPIHAIEVDFDFLFPTQPSALESEKLTKIASPDVSQPHQSSKVSSSIKAPVEGEPSSESSEPSTPTSHHQSGPVITPVTASFEGEPPLNGSILKGTLQSSQPSSPWFQGEPHSTGSSPSSSFTSTPSVEFKHATVEGEPPVSGSSGLFQDDLFEGTFTSDYPPRPREQYEDFVCPLEPFVISKDFVSLLEPLVINKDFVCPLEPFVINKDFVSLLEPLVINKDFVCPLEPFVINKDFVSLLEPLVINKDFVCPLEQFVINKDFVSPLEPFVINKDS